MSPATALLIRYSEIGLKGGNRPQFERLLAQNLRTALAGRPGVRVSRIRGRALVEADVPAEQLAEAASRVFGVASLSTAVRTGREPAEISLAARDLTGKALAREFPGRDQVPFRVTTNRADKSFPITSMELDRMLGQDLRTAHPQLRVDLDHHELNLEVDVRPEGTWLFADRRPGPGGLPVGSLGRGMCLLSGGIDSPVAAWLAMKRGVRAEFATFYSFPHVGPQSREKVIRLVERLAAWQPASVLHVVPFAGYQEAVRDCCPAAYRTVLYRRGMQRIATRLARRRRCQVLVTGESIGQVASQTLENLSIIEDASDLPVIRPLVTYDKHEVIAQARRIGTYEISVLPAQDCCTVFQPDSPVIRGRIEEVREAESALDLEALAGEAVRSTETLRFSQEP